MWLSNRGREQGGNSHDEHTPSLRATPLKRGPNPSNACASKSPLERGARRAGCVSVTAFVFVFLFALLATAQPPDGTAGSPRWHQTLDTGWRSLVAADGEDTLPADRWTYAAFDDRAWATVAVPHNWDAYHGFRQVKHGNLHGTAWYRRNFTVDLAARGRRVFLFFEGVGSYATIWVNGRRVGEHAGGLTTFTLDVTDAVRLDGPNQLAVRAEHPAHIRDLPWVCGGCERVIGFSEGSQPLGIFRPVHVVVTDPLRIAPFGVHVWNDADASAASATLHVRTELKNHGAHARTFALRTRLVGGDGRVAVEHTTTPVTLAAGAAVTLAQDPPPLVAPRLWSLEDAHLYTVLSEIIDAGNGAIIDRSETAFGVRTLRWPAPGDPQADGRFFLNGEPVFINGTAEYEHLLGGSHAFSAELISARVRQMQAAGFNAFRDAHTPHNLRYGDHWARDGVLWWPQFSAHAWFDNAAFRENFKARLRDWVKERRNNPAVMLWGLQNESKLPPAFAAECAAIIRKLDPTASEQRLVTTCNGGKGTDWDVPQNWTGTYGGDPATYADDLRRQRLVGEYGAWRSLGLHTEGGFNADGPYSEERMTALMETKVRLGESVRDEVSGHFAWLFATHANPGRDVGEKGQQTRDGWRELDQIGPANNKGLLTIWGEPLDVFYMFRSNYAPAATEPMVYIASHTWPDRWTEPGRKSGIVVYSNCDEVELFNDWRRDSLGVRTRAGKGTHFRWDDVEIRHNVLYAEGRVRGRVVATDLIVLHHLPVAPEFARHEAAQPVLVAPVKGHNYLYRVNCGGPGYTDTQGNRWLADRDYTAGDSWGGESWAAQFPNLTPAFGSRRKIFDPIGNAQDDTLFQTFRYGREQLRYHFAVPDGDYRIELYFIEPWYGTGGGLDCTGWRLFDVAVNSETVLRDLDVWKEAGGRARALKKVVNARAVGGRLEIAFPRVASYQAVISAIAISTEDPNARAPALPPPLIQDLHAGGFSVRGDLDTGDPLQTDGGDTIVALPEELVGADWIQVSRSSRRDQAGVRFRVSADAEVFVALEQNVAVQPQTTTTVNDTHRWTATSARRRLPNAGKTRPEVAFHLEPAANAPLSSTENTHTTWLADWQETGQTLATRWSRFTLYRKSFRVGAPVVLAPASGEAVPAAVIVKRTRPLPSPQVVEGFTAPAGDARAVGHLKTGQPLFADDGATFAGIPAILSDADWIQLSNRNETAGRASFTVNDHVEVYVAPTSPASAPAWLADWVKTNLPVAMSGHEPLRLFKRRFPTDTHVTLDLAGLATAMVRAVRPSTLYEAEDAGFAGGAALTTSLAGFTGRGAVSISTSASDASISWTVTVGVGAKYGLNFRYATNSSAPITAELQIIDGEGRVMHTDPVEFAPAAPAGAWTFFRTRTGVSINAGTYQLRLTRLHGDSPIFFDSLEVE